MADNKQHDTRTARRPDCVTEIRMGNSVRRGYWKRKPLLRKNRPIRREPEHGKSGHAGSVAAGILPFLVNQFRNAITAAGSNKTQIDFQPVIRKKPCAVP